MVKESSFSFPDIIKVEGRIDQRHQFLAFSHQVYQLFHNILEVLVGSIVTDHSLNKPLIFDSVVEKATIDSLCQAAKV